jgi:hypothetical protein
MSLAQRFERRLEGLVGSAFARVFKGQVEPVEIGAALQREAADKRNIMGNGQVMSPNRYRVTLSGSDYERLVPWEAQLTNSLAELVQEYLDENRWATIGDVEVYLAHDEQLHTGVFGVASRMEPDAPPRRRPHDSLSMPAISADDYPDQYGADPYVDPYARGQQQYDGQQQYGPHGQYAPPAAGFAGASGYPPQQFAAPPQAWNPPPPPQASAPVPPPAAPQPPSATAALVIDQTNQRHELRVGSNIIGRGDAADLQLLDHGVSRRHLDVQYDGNFATAYDLGSTNGSIVNGREITSQLLRHGDVIRIGHTRIVFQQERR